MCLEGGISRSQPCDDTGNNRNIIIIDNEERISGGA